MTPRTGCRVGLRSPLAKSSLNLYSFKIIITGFSDKLFCLYILIVSHIVPTTLIAKKFDLFIKIVEPVKV